MWNCPMRCQLDNPYDDTEREAEGLVRDEDYIMDAAYYQEIIMCISA